MRLLVRCGIALSIAALAACGERPRPDAGPPPAAPEPERPAPSSTGRCTLSEETRVAGDLPVPHGIAIASADTATMIVVDRDPETLLAFGARVAAGARGVPVAVSGADEIFGVEAIDGDRFVAITHGRCPADVASTRCLVAVLLGADGRPIGAPVPIGLGGPLRTVRVATSGDAVYVARSQALGAPELDTIRATDAGLEARTLRLGEGLDLAEVGTEIIGVAVTGGSWAVLWRHGAAEDPTSAVVLSTQLDEHEVEALHDALVLESFQWYAGALSMIAAFEFARPRFLRIGADGEIRGEPRDLPRDQPLPAPFVARHRGAIVGGGENAALEIRDGAGDRIDLVPFGAPDVVVADVARRADALVLAIARRDGSIVSREVTCRARAREGATE